MKRDASKLLKRFSFKMPKTGDLVLTAQVFRVIRTERDYRNGGNVLIVSNVFPPCQECRKFYKTKAGKAVSNKYNGACCHEHVMRYGEGGQHSVMLPK